MSHIKRSQPFPLCRHGVWNHVHPCRSGKTWSMPPSLQQIRWSDVSTLEVQRAFKCGGRCQQVQCLFGRGSTQIHFILIMSYLLGGEWVYWETVHLIIDLHGFLAARWKKEDGVRCPTDPGVPRWRAFALGWRGVPRVDWCRVGRMDGWLTRTHCSYIRFFHISILHKLCCLIGDSLLWFVECIL